jgi:hypothetical protein
MAKTWYYYGLDFENLYSRNTLILLAVLRFNRGALARAGAIAHKMSNIMGTIK